MTDKDNGIDSDRPIEFSGPDMRSEAPGRRKYPVADCQCAEHDIIRESDMACFASIKKAASEQNARIDRMSEALSDKLNNFVSKWVAGIITMVAVSFLVLFFGVAFKQLAEGRASLTEQLQRMENNIEKISGSVEIIEDETDKSSIKQAKIVTVQGHIVETVIAIKQTQQKFWQDLETIKYDLKAATICEDEMYLDE
jgi:hypothetical protein